MSISEINIDQQVLYRIASGDQQAFKKLFDQFWQPIYAAVHSLVRSREMTRDMLQEIFLKIWDNREQLPEKDNIHNFIFIIARNHIYNELRKKSVEQEFSDHIMQFLIEKSGDALDQLIYKESRELVHEAVNQLPPQQRQVYILTREQGLSQKEIAENLQISISTVKNHMSRALSFIRDYILQRSGKDPFLLILITETLKKFL